MEQTQSPEKTPCRDSTLNCQSDSCAKPPTHYCRDHSQVLCANCSADFHGKCNCDQMPFKNEVTDSLDLIKSLLNFVQENSECFRASSDAKHFEEELTMFKEMHAKIDEKLNASTEDNRFYELISVIKEVFQLQKALIESYLLDHFSKVKELRQAVTAGSFSRQMVADLQRILNEVIQIGESRCNMTDTVTEEEKISFKTTKKPTEQTQRDSNSPVELKQQMRIVDDAAVNERKQMEKHIHEKEQQIQTAVFSRICERNMNRKISSIPEFCFGIDLTIIKDRNLLKYLKMQNSDFQICRLFRLKKFQMKMQNSSVSSMIALLPNSSSSDLTLFHTFLKQQRPNFTCGHCPN